MSDLLHQRQHDIAEEFEFFEDWMERYEHIIELGRELDPIAEEDKLDEHLIRGCQSRVWLLAAKDGEGNVQFQIREKDDAEESEEGSHFAAAATGRAPSQFPSTMLHTMQ